MELNSLVNKSILYIREHWEKVSFAIILLLTTFLTFYQFPSIPGGLNQDEADAAIEAYSLLRHGTDQWGYHLPVYFVSWGSGQNVLQSYLDIPIIKVFGLSIFSIRLIPAILGVLSVLLVYFVVKKVYSAKAGILAALLLAVMPWHIMVSRWSLESNLLPFFILLGIFTFIYSYDSKYKKYLIPFSLIPFALSFYAYIVSVIIMPFLLLALLISHAKVAISHIWSTVVSFIIFGVLSSPIAIFIIDNNIIHHTPHFVNKLPFSVPILAASRLAQNNSGQNMLLDNLHFFTSGLNDGSIWSIMPGYGTLGLLSIPLAFAGIYFSLRKFSKSSLVFMFWLVASIPVALLTVLDVNRANSFFIPLVALNAIGIIGIYDFLPRKKVKLGFLIFLIFPVLAYSTAFSCEYFSTYNQITQSEFNTGLGEALTEAKKVANPNEKIYLTDSIALNYVQALFYLKADSLDFRTHSTYALNGGGFYDVTNYRNYYFYPDRLNMKQGEQFVYILKVGDAISCSQYKNIYNSGLWTVGQCTV